MQERDEVKMLFPSSRIKSVSFWGYLLPPRDPARQSDPLGRTCTNVEDDSIDVTYHPCLIEDR